MIQLRHSFCVGLCLLLTTSEICAQQNASLESMTKFIFYGKKNAAPYVSTSRNDSLFERITGCNPEDIYAIIVHGFNESCNASWAQELRRNLQKYRRGCIICMDYGAYAGNYDFLLIHFKEIVEILTAKLYALRDYEFSSCTAYVFGFSFGSRIAAQAGNDYGPQQIERMDLCELAGPGFDNTTTADPKLAALEVQCIHTNAGGLGTLQRNCHQDWLMGNCGISQVAARPYPNGNHGLCPQFYNFAFEYDFPAIEKAKTCNETKDARDAIYWPRDFHMGYYQYARAKYLDQKNFYAKTTKDPPFTPYTYPIN